MRQGGEYFTDPQGPARRRYEALRAYFVEEMPAAEVADRFGYSTASVHQMATLLRGGKLQLFTQSRPGPKGPRIAGKVRDKALALRARDHSVTEIADALTASGTPVSAQTVWKIMENEGLPRLACRNRHPLRPRRAAAAAVPRHGDPAATRADRRLRLPLHQPAVILAVACRPAARQVRPDLPHPPHQRVHRRRRAGPGPRADRPAQGHPPDQLLLQGPPRLQPQTPTAADRRAPQPPARDRNGRVQPRLPRHPPPRRRCCPGRPLRARPLPTHPLGAHLLRPRPRLHRDGLRQRRPHQGRAAPRDHRLRRLLAPGHRHRSRPARARLPAHHLRRPKRTVRPRHHLAHPAQTRPQSPRRPRCAARIGVETRPDQARRQLPPPPPARRPGHPQRHPRPRPADRRQEHRPSRAHPAHHRRPHHTGSQPLRPLRRTHAHRKRARRLHRRLPPQRPVLRRAAQRRSRHHPHRPGRQPLPALRPRPQPLPNHHPRHHLAALPRRHRHPARHRRHPHLRAQPAQQPPRPHPGRLRRSRPGNPLVGRTNPALHLPATLTRLQRRRPTNASNPPHNQRSLNRKHTRASPNLNSITAPKIEVRSEPVRRAEFNKAVLALAATVLLDPDRLNAPSTIDAALLHDLESLTVDLAHRHHYARPHTIIGPIRAHLRYLLCLDPTNARQDLQPRLARVTATTAAIAGWVVFRGHGDLVTAHAQLALGRDHARTAGDNLLLAQILAATSSLYSSLDIPHFDGDPTSVLALNLLHAANRKADDTALALRGWLAARIAEEEALLDNGRKARAALARAESTLPNRPARDEDGLFCFWDETRFPGYAGKTLLILCDPAATSLLENALNVTQAPHPRFGLLVDLAIARVHDGDADDAVRLLTEATQLALDRGIDGFARWRLQEGRHELPGSQRAAFDERLVALA